MGVCIPAVRRTPPPHSAPGPRHPRHRSSPSPHPLTWHPQHSWLHPRLMALPQSALHLGGRGGRTGRNSPAATAGVGLGGRAPRPSAVSFGLGGRTPLPGAASVRGGGRRRPHRCLPDCHRQVRPFVWRPPRALPRLASAGRGPAAKTRGAHPSGCPLGSSGRRPGRCPGHIHTRRRRRHRRRRNGTAHHPLPSVHRLASHSRRLIALFLARRAVVIVPCSRGR